MRSRRSVRLRLRRWSVAPLPSCYCSWKSPIIISLSKNGIRLTSASDGVKFDLDADAVKLEQIAWTAIDSDDVFLVLDRNSNGRIDNGKELFGNLTEQAPSHHPNGFLALASFRQTGKRR